jgi:aspartate carbamoyltransferase regulatory subunit
MQLSDRNEQARVILDHLSAKQGLLVLLALAIPLVVWEQPWVAVKRSSSDEYSDLCEVPDSCLKRQAIDMGRKPGNADVIG